MKSYKVLNLWRVPKQGTIDHHEALKVLLFFICCVFCFCDVLLLAGDEFYFYFFMVVIVINIDPTGILHYFGACGWWMWPLHIIKDVMVVFHEAFHPSICLVIHPWMASLQPMWLRFCCTRKNNHIIHEHFFFGEILPTGDKKKPSATSRKEF